MAKAEFDYLSIGTQVIRDEFLALEELPHYLDDKFNQVCSILEHCPGRVILIGVGQSFHVAKKSSTSMSSLGRPSFYMHATEALHGDMGLITGDDVVIFISNSGETPELLKIIEPIKRINPKTIAIVSKKGSSLEAQCDMTIVTGVMKEGGPIKFAPSSSALVMIALLDAMTMAIAMSIGFTEKDYLQYHPGGDIGKRLSEKVNK
jgi:arabinose-5-phosphate isomerase